MPVADTENINHLLKASEKLSPDSAIVLLNQALQLSITANYADGAFTALNTIGMTFFRKADYDSARSFYNKALPWAAKAFEKDATAWCYSNLGDTYIGEGNFVLASENLYKALEEIEKLPPAPYLALANIYNNIGILNRHLDHPDTELVYYNKAEVVARSGNHWHQLADVCNLKGAYYLDLGKVDSARKYYDLELEIGKNTDNDMLVSWAKLALGDICLKTAEYEQAMIYFRQVLAIAKNRYYEMALIATFSAGEVYSKQKQFDEAEKIFLSALREMKIRKTKGYYILGYTRLATFYEEWGQYKTALNYYDTLNIIKDSIKSLEKAKAVKSIELKYKTAEKDKLIAQNQLIIAQQHDKIVQKNIWFGSITGIIILLAVVMAGLYYRARQKQWVQQEQIKLLQSENTVSILKGVVQGEEKERTRLARELHDGIGGMLSVAMLRLSSIKQENDAAGNQQAFEQGMKILTTMGEEIRKTAHNLMPDVLEKMELQDAIANFCSQVNEGDRLRIDFQAIGDFANLEKEFKLNVYRIVQELIKNVIQHARATTVIVQLLMHKNLLSITVEDNGAGYDTSKNYTGIGLQNLQTRIRSMNGRYSVESAAGKGTSVLIEFDL